MNFIEAVKAKLEGKEPSLRESACASTKKLFVSGDDGSILYSGIRAIVIQDGLSYEYDLQPLWILSDQWRIEEPTKPFPHDGKLGVW